MKIAALLPPVPHANDSQDAQIVGGIAASKKPVMLSRLFLLPNALGYRKPPHFQKAGLFFGSPYSCQRLVKSTVGKPSTICLKPKNESTQVCFCHLATTAFKLLGRNSSR